MITLDQQKFLWIVNHSDVKSIKQAENDVVIVNVRDNIQITHCWKKNNRMELIITDDQSHYVIPDKSHLEEILTLHIDNKDLTQILKDYCDKNLEKC